MPPPPDDDAFLLDLFRRYGVEAIGVALKSVSTTPAQRTEQPGAGLSRPPSGRPRIPEGPAEEETASVSLFKGWYTRLQDLPPLTQDEMVAAAQVLDLYRRPLPDGLAANSAGEVFDLDSRPARDSFDKMVSHNLRLVRDVALRYRRHFSPLPLDDLFQMGAVGLLRAVELWDWRRGYAFSTYAIIWIRQRLVRGAIDTLSIARLPVHRFKGLRRTHDGWWVSQSGARIGVHPLDPLWPLGPIASLDSLVDRDLADALIGDLHQASQLDLVLSRVLAGSLKERVEHLAERDAYVILTRLGVARFIEDTSEGPVSTAIGLDLDDMSLRAVGKVIGKSGEWVRKIQIEARRDLLADLRRSGFFEAWALPAIAASELVTDKT